MTGTKKLEFSQRRLPSGLLTPANVGRMNPHPGQASILPVYNASMALALCRLTNVGPDYISAKLRSIRRPMS